MSEVEDIFRHFDKDGSGAIDVRELNDLMEALGADIPQNELDVALKALDADGNGFIDLAEFKAWWQER